jgi:hypothetical protein
LNPFGLRQFLQGLSQLVDALARKDLSLKSQMIVDQELHQPLYAVEAWQAMTVLLVAHT